MTSTAPRLNLERWAPLPPLLLVNVVAFYGQFGWAERNLPAIHVNGRDLPVWAVMFALALESIAVYVSYEAHKARMAGDSSAKLWGAAYAVALLAGGLNYWHFADPVTHHPTPSAVAFGVLSVLSPWLWGVRSRSLNRDQLRSLGLIEPRAVKFSTARWVLFPVSTWRAFRRAVWAGETDPMAAVGLLEVPAPAVAAAPAPRAPETAAPSAPPSAPTPAAVREPIRRTRPAALAGPKPAPSREEARAILLALDSLDAKTNAELHREHGGTPEFWGQRKKALRAELADFNREAHAL